MDSLDIYFRLPTWLQSTAISVYGLRLRSVRYGIGHETRVRDLRARERRSAEDVRSAQLQKLAETLIHAGTKVPYYREQDLPIPAHPNEAEDILRSWPLLEKSAVQAADRALLAEPYESGRGLIELHTGGTSGRALRIWCDKKALRVNYAFFERFKRWAGIRRLDKVATFAGRPIVPPGASRPPYWRHNVSSRQLLCSSYHISAASVDDYLDALERFRPALIDAYPSSIEPLARGILNRGGSRISVRAVITSSETLFASARRTIERAFSCRVFDYYGSAEMVALVTQCEAGGYHPNPEFGFLEVLRPDGTPAAADEDGEIVATGFVNRVMPLVRYRLGDLAVASQRSCACGRPYPLLERITGRIDDAIVTPQGRRVGRLDPIFKAVHSLHEARIVQTAPDRVRLDMVTGPDFVEADQAALVSELRVRLGPEMTVEFRRVKAIPRTESGKLRTVVSAYGRALTE